MHSACLFRSSWNIFIANTKDRIIQVYERSKFPLTLSILTSIGFSSSCQSTYASRTRINTLILNQHFFVYFLKKYVYIIYYLFKLTKVGNGLKLHFRIYYLEITYVTERLVRPCGRNPHLSPPLHPPKLWKCNSTSWKWIVTYKLTSLNLRIVVQICNFLINIMFNKFYIL